MIGGADDATCRKLYDFGINVGLGFQLKDDLLDVYADTVKFGKQSGGDIISNKKTYLLIKALELAEGRNMEILQYWLDQKSFDADEKVQAVVDVYNSLSIKEISEKKMNSYFDAGLEIFESLPIDQQKKKALEKLVLNLIDREK
jgi:geranylgeranyl diphosphate synthase type II